MKRRDFFKTSGSLVVTFAFARLPELALAQSAGAELPKPLEPGDVDSFLAVHADGGITLYMGKVDIGTGLRIAIAQMAAEELGVPADRITVVDGDTALCPDQGGTGGSTGLTRGGTEIRRVAATARQALQSIG